MIKKIISYILTFTIALSLFTTVPAFAKDTEGDLLKLLSSLEIMSGDPDGNMRLNDNVSRAEFVKVAVASSAYKNSVATNLALSPFPDVTYQHWASPYVRVGVTNNIVSGYPDGTFRPENSVLYEEAVTILLKVLGYENTDFGASWPSGQIGIANNLDMTDNVGAAIGQPINRRQVARLVYNALKIKFKNQQNLLISVFDATIYKDTTIIASSNEDSSISSDEIFTSSGTFKIEKDFDSSLIGLKGDAIVKGSSKLVGFVPSSSSTDAAEYIVYSVLSDKVMAYRNGSMSQLNIEDDTTAYKGKSKLTFASLKPQLELGDRLIVRFGDTGDIDYVTYGKGNIDGPVTALNGSYKNTFALTDNTTVTRNGNSATFNDIQNYDVLYYLNDLDILLAYSNKVTGIYEKATPNRDVPTSITVSGTTYEIEGSAAFNKLYSGGEFEYGDTITLLLGKNNKIADVATPNAASSGIAGYITQTGSKEYAKGDVSTYINYFIKLVQPDGNQYEYITDKDYSDYINSVVELSFTNGYARLRSANSNAISGKFDWDNKKLGRFKLASSVNILDIGYIGADQASSYAKIYGQRLDGVTLSSKSILYANKNSSGEITDLILNNVTNDSFTYGIVTNANVIENEYSDRADTSTYQYISNGSHYSAKINGRFNVSRGTVAKISGPVNNPSSLSPIESIKTKITGFTSAQITTSNDVYKLADDVQVYTRTSSTANDYSMITIDDLVSNKDNYNILAYYDKSSAYGGRVRIIIATKI